MLRPHSYQANLDVWCFYTEDLISRFPPYDVELIAEGGLTYSDLHHDVFAWDNSITEIGVPIDPPPEVANEITHLLKQYTGEPHICAYTPLYKGHHLGRNKCILNVVFI